ncbi:hypothetical protein HOLleu_03577 [Holothuria leucospilota]|uniref:Uncharacterized protein n=1 Tax=Holothuria leucospilota TaxID=206669 RepID=A0A9Q1CT68_HOLLE|nr:hypothetical protein HOLleu_03577 [Holothuria leucospilota]
MDGSIKRTTLLIVHFLCLLDDVFAQNQCYECNYSILRSSDTTSGPEACYEPFFNPAADGIKRVNCTGECEYIVQETSDIFQATRGCSVFDTCLESSSTTLDGSSVTIHCCSGSLCNDETITKEPAETLGDDECYTCTYVEGASGTVGSPGCFEPFDASAIGVVKTQCNSSCELTVVKSGGDLTVTRGCRDFDFECETSCVTFSGDSVCTYCCNPGNVCNKGTLNFLSLSSFLATIFVSFEFFM